jgi:hypothetical protein
MPARMANLIRSLVHQQKHIIDLCDFDEYPVVRPPIKSETLIKLETWWLGFGSPIPPSYREFLLVCDGIEYFSLSYGLLGGRDLLSPSYPNLLKEVLDAGIGLERSSENGLVLIGYDPETTTRVFVDLLHEPLIPHEAVVFDGDPGDLSLHASFAKFLELKVIANEKTIEQLEAMRTNGFHE